MLHARPSRRPRECAPRHPARGAVRVGAMPDASPTFRRNRLLSSEAARNADARSASLSSPRSLPTSTRPRRRAEEHSNRCRRATPTSPPIFSVDDELGAALDAFLVKIPAERSAPPSRPSLPAVAFRVTLSRPIAARRLGSLTSLLLGLPILGQVRVRSVVSPRSRRSGLARPADGRDLHRYGYDPWSARSSRDRRRRHPGLDSVAMAHATRRRLARTVVSWHAHARRRPRRTGSLITEPAVPFYRRGSRRRPQRSLRCREGAQRELEGVEGTRCDRDRSVGRARHGAHRPDATKSFTPIGGFRVQAAASAERGSA